MTAAAILLAFLPLSPVRVETCETVEINNYYDENGKHIFEQWIFWDYPCGHPCCVDWCFRARIAGLQRDIYGYRVYVRADYGGRIVCVRARSLKFSWTQYDPEVENRDLFPQERRPCILKK